MRRFEKAAEVLREIYEVRHELRTARGLRKKDLQKYHNRLVKIYEQMRIAESKERQKE